MYESAGIDQFSLETRLLVFDRVSSLNLIRIIWKLDSLEERKIIFLRYIYIYTRIKQLASSCTKVDKCVSLRV